MIPVCIHFDIGKRCVHNGVNVDIQLTDTSYTSYITTILNKGTLLYLRCFIHILIVEYEFERDFAIELKLN